MVGSTAWPITSPDAATKNGVGIAENFKQATLSRRDKGQVPDKFEGRKLRIRRDDDALPPGARRGLSRNGAPGRGVPGTRLEEEENRKAENEEEEAEGQVEGEVEGDGWEVTVARHRVETWKNPCA